MYLLCLKKSFSGSPCRLCSPSYHLWNVSCKYLGWKFYWKYILRKNILENIQTLLFYVCQHLQCGNYDFWKDLNSASKTELSINICSCSKVNHLRLKIPVSITLREKCPNTEFFLVRIFLYSDWIWRFTEQICVFSPNTTKYGPEKTPYLNTFHAV